MQVFQGWRVDQDNRRQAEREKLEADRKRKGMMTGREIFAEARCVSPPPSVLFLLQGQVWKRGSSKESNRQVDRKHKDM